MAKKKREVKREFKGLRELRNKAKKEWTHQPSAQEILDEVSGSMK